MIEKNFIFLLAISVFISLAFLLIFKYNFLEFFIYSFLALAFPFFLTYYIASKFGIYLKVELWNVGLIISLILSFIKIPLFPFLYLEAYYKYFERILRKQITQKEIASYSLLFVFLIFSIALISILFNLKLSLISFSILFSILLPYKNSPGNQIMLLNPLLYGLLLAFSFISYLFLLIFL